MDDIASDALTGRLLVATPLLGDPNFRRTVVLVVEHEPEPVSYTHLTLPTICSV